MKKTLIIILLYSAFAVFFSCGTRKVEKQSEKEKVNLEVDSSVVRESQTSEVSGAESQRMTKAEIFELLQNLRLAPVDPDKDFHFTIAEDSAGNTTFSGKNVNVDQTTKQTKAQSQDTISKVENSAKTAHKKKAVNLDKKLDQTKKSKGKKTESDKGSWGLNLGWLFIILAIIAFFFWKRHPIASSVGKIISKIKNLI
ncbi:MAG: hypothetical protein WBG71_00045 [Leeuwenhoekiella sp.]